MSIHLYQAILYIILSGIYLNTIQKNSWLNVLWNWKRVNAQYLILAIISSCWRRNLFFTGKLWHWKELLGITGRKWKPKEFYCRYIFQNTFPIHFKINLFCSSLVKSNRNQTKLETLSKSTILYEYKILIKSKL